jgi:hypothetical protein
MIAANLRLRNDQLARVAIVRASKGVVQNADSFQDVSSYLNLPREIRGVSKNLLRFCCELHRFLSTSILHGGLDSNSLGAFVNDFINVGVEHIRSAIDSRQTCEALWQFSKTVKWVNIWRLSISRHRVSIQSNAFDRLWSTPFLGEVFVGLVESHGVTNEVSSSSLESEFVINVFHRACIDVETYIVSKVRTQICRIAPLWLAESASLNVPIHSMKLFILLFSNRPINDERRASPASEGTFATVALGPEYCWT